MRIARRSRLGIACASVALVMTGCSMADSSEPVADDTMTFCAQLGGRMMVMSDMAKGKTPDQEAFQQSGVELQDTADKIASSDSEWPQLGQTTTAFLAATNASDMSAAHGELERYCNEHKLSPFPQAG